MQKNTGIETGYVKIDELAICCRLGINSIPMPIKVAYDCSVSYNYIIGISGDTNRSCQRISIKIKINIASGDINMRRRIIAQSIDPWHIFRRSCT
jgi:hypothetical protein